MSRGPLEEPWICPVCAKGSYHPMDAEHGYCNACKVCTGNPEIMELLELYRQAGDYDLLPANVARIWRERDNVEAV